jgi:hypothetical protein
MKRARMPSLSFWSQHSGSPFLHPLPHQAPASQAHITPAKGYAWEALQKSRCSTTIATRGGWPWRAIAKSAAADPGSGGDVRKKAGVRRAVKPTVAPGNKRKRRQSCGPTRRCEVFALSWVAR